MTYKILAGVVLALVAVVLVALEVRATGSYERTFNASQDKDGERGTMRIR